MVSAKATRYAAMSPSLGYNTAMGKKHSIIGTIITSGIYGWSWQVALTNLIADLTLDVLIVNFGSSDRRSDGVQPRKGTRANMLVCW